MVHKRSWLHRSWCSTRHGTQRSSVRHIRAIGGVPVLVSATARYGYSEHISSPILVMLTFGAVTCPITSNACRIVFKPTIEK